MEFHCHSRITHLDGDMITPEYLDAHLQIIGGKEMYGRDPAVFQRAGA